jgi:hypothetical protein
VACPTGYVISGGCTAAQPTIAVVSSIPGGPPADGSAASSVTQWSCVFSANSTAHRAFALCCNN